MSYTTSPNCPRCLKWRGAHATLPGQSRDHLCQCPPDQRPDGMPASADERYLRRLLAGRVAMPHTYTDDGEAQGQEHGISIDFMREPVADIDAKLRALNVARMECAAAKPT